MASAFVVSNNSCLWCRQDQHEANLPCKWFEKIKNNTEDSATSPTLLSSPTLSFFLGISGRDSSEGWRVVTAPVLQSHLFVWILCEPLSKLNTMPCHHIIIISSCLAFGLFASYNCFGSLFFFSSLCGYAHIYLSLFCLIVEHMNPIHYFVLAQKSIPRVYYNYPNIFTTFYSILLFCFKRHSPYKHFLKLLLYLYSISYLFLIMYFIFTK
jgi:hypothetical protein